MAIRKAEHLHAAELGKGKSVFYQAIRKYGRDSFVWSILGVYRTNAEALGAEIQFIAEMKPEYNLTRGGDGALPVLFAARKRETKLEPRSVVESNLQNMLRSLLSYELAGNSGIM